MFINVRINNWWLLLLSIILLLASITAPISTLVAKETKTDAFSSAGGRIPSDLYLYMMTAGDFKTTRKMVTLE